MAVARQSVIGLGESPASSLKMNAEFDAIYAAINATSKLWKGPNPPSVGTSDSGWTWLDDSATPWRLKVYDAPTGTWTTVASVGVLESHVANHGNPHQVTPAQIGPIPIGTLQAVAPPGQVLRVGPNNTVVPGALMSATEATFLFLSDTPASYAGKAGMGLRVNAGETGLEFGVWDLGMIIALGGE